MSEVFAARHAIPHMLEQGSGYLLNVASAVGLLVIPDTVSYTVTKHAAIGFTEWLAVMYGRSHADPRGQGGYAGGPGRHHHRAARRNRGQGARGRALHDQYARVGAREVRDQGEP
jgi:hypothetical protein